MSLKTNPGKKKKNTKNKPCVLIAVDKTDTREHLTSVLSEGYNIISASNGKEAKELLNKQMVDIVLTEVALPEMNGFELLNYIRNKMETSRLPVIMVSDENRDDLRMEVFEAGADALLLKPYNPHEILIYVNTYFEVTRLRAKETVNDEMVQKDKALQRSDERLKAIFDNLEEGLITFEPEGRVLDWNPAALKMHGFKFVESKENFIARISEILESTTIDGTFIEFEQWPINRVKHGENFSDYPVFLRNKEFGWKKLILYSSKIVNDSSGIPLIGFLSMRDITRQKKAEDTLRQSEERFRTLADNISQLAWMGDEGGALFWYNKRWYDFTGTTFDEMQGWGWKKIHHPDHIDRVMERWTDALTEGKPWEDIFPLQSKEGDFRWFLSRAVPIHDDNGKILRWFGTNTDITEHKNSEEELLEAYKNIEERLIEKEVLLQEIYHRTKNNLQLISSMLRMKTSTVEDPALQDIVDDMQARIKAIALVHIRLYKGENLSKVNLHDYIIDLAELLLSNNVTNHRISFRHELEQIKLIIDATIPCGLIITEIIQNSIKHAFPGDREGYIEIKLKKIGDEEIELIVADNGIGFNESDLDKRESLGLQIIRGIAEAQLEALVDLNVENGVKWTIKFKDMLYFERVK